MAVASMEAADAEASALEAAVAERLRRLRRLRLRWLGSLYMAMATWLVLGRVYTSG